jgi:hypothetical protein
MHLKLIACNVFQREACYCMAAAPHIIDPVFIELGEHAQPAHLRDVIQSHIDAALDGPRVYDAVLLLFGLCGNACVGLDARSCPLIIPRAHDCCTILLGSRDRFVELFGDNPSTPFGSVGYLERGDYYLRTDDDGCSVHYGDSYAAHVEQYGEENAKYIWEMMNPRHESNDTRVVFIDVPETSRPEVADEFTRKAEAEGKQCQFVEGSLELIRKLIGGDWNADEFLTVLPGEMTHGVYDWHEVIRSVPAAD